jgi:hypothetical protein
MTSTITPPKKMSELSADAKTIIKAVYDNYDEEEAVIDFLNFEESFSSFIRMSVSSALRATAQILLETNPNFMADRYVWGVDSAADLVISIADELKKSTHSQDNNGS